MSSLDLFPWELQVLLLHFHGGGSSLSDPKSPALIKPGGLTLKQPRAAWAQLCLLLPLPGVGWQVMLAPERFAICLARAD